MLMWMQNACLSAKAPSHAADWILLLLCQAWRRELWWGTVLDTRLEIYHYLTFWEPPSDFSGFVNTYLDGCCSLLLGCGRGQFVISIFWKEKLRMNNQRKPLETAAIGVQEPLNVKCTFSSSLHVVCLMLELILIVKAWLCLRAECGVSLARAAASAKHGWES